eukprot:g75051.t1
MYVCVCVYEQSRWYPRQIEEIGKGRDIKFTATRFYSSNQRDIKNLHSFLDRACSYSTHILVALNSQTMTDKAMRLTKTYQKRKECLGVEVRFINMNPLGLTTTLNSIALLAGREGASYLLIQSIEVKALSSHVDLLYRALDSHLNATVLNAAVAKTSLLTTPTAAARTNGPSSGPSGILAAGFSLSPYHEFEEGLHTITGLRSPWNTMCLWHLPSLMLTGFPLVSEGLTGGTGYGIEEVVTVSLLQQLSASPAPRLHASRQLVLLINQDVRWDWEKDLSADRVASKQEQMRTKNVRAKQQVQALGVSPDTVYH